MTGLGIFTGVNDGYDRHAVHNKEEEQIGAGQWSSEIHGPHPDYWQPTQEVERAAGSRNADELALVGHYTGALQG